MFVDSKIESSDAMKPHQTPYYSFTTSYSILQDGAIGRTEEQVTRDVLDEESLRMTQSARAIRKDQSYRLELRLLSSCSAPSTQHRFIAFSPAPLYDRVRLSVDGRQVQRSRLS